MALKRIINSHIQFLIMIFILAMMNIIGTQSTLLSLIAAMVEYVIIISALVRGDFAMTYIYFLAFTGISLEHDFFIYGDAESINHYSFLNIPFAHGYLRWTISIICCWGAFHEFIKHHVLLSKYQKDLLKWIFVLFVSGMMAIILAMILNDNNIMYYPEIYPKQAIIDIIGFLIKACILFTPMFLVTRKNWVHMCSVYLQLLLIAIAFSSGVSSMIGFFGFYSDDVIMLAPLSIAYTPILILFVKRKVITPYRMLSIIAGIFAIVISFIYGGVAIGSKWYLIIIFTLMGLLISSIQLKKAWSIILLIIFGLAILPVVIEPIILLTPANEYISWKVTQALNTINIFRQGGAEIWYTEMDRSPLFRFDELHNILIEYSEKPWFSVFGKGLGGNILHHTHLLDWEHSHGTFTAEQQQIGLYWRMHESLAVIFLQHGLVGVYFFCKMIMLLLKSIYKSPWAIMGIVWLFFFWSYGSALAIGSVAIFLALTDYPTNVTVERQY